MEDGSRVGGYCSGCMHHRLPNESPLYTVHSASLSRLGCKRSCARVVRCLRARPRLRAAPSADHRARLAWPSAGRSRRMAAIRPSRLAHGTCVEAPFRNGTTNDVTNLCVSTVLLLGKGSRSFDLVQPRPWPACSLCAGASRVRGACCPHPDARGLPLSRLPLSSYLRAMTTSVVNRYEWYSWYLFYRDWPRECESASARETENRDRAPIRDHHIGGNRQS